MDPQFVEDRWRQLSLFPRSSHGARSRREQPRGPAGGAVAAAERQSRNLQGPAGGPLRYHRRRRGNQVSRNCPLLLLISLSSRFHALGPKTGAVSSSSLTASRFAARCAPPFFSALQ